MAVMRIEDFELERFFARYEFAVRHLLCASDVEGWPMADLLALADAAEDHGVLEAEVAAVGGKAFGDLHGEFAGGC